MYKKDKRTKLLLLEFLAIPKTVFRKIYIYIWKRAQGRYETFKNLFNQFCQQSLIGKNYDECKWGYMNISNGILKEKQNRYKLAE